MQPRGDAGLVRAGIFGRNFRWLVQHRREEMRMRARSSLARLPMVSAVSSGY